MSPTSMVTGIESEVQERISWTDLGLVGTQADLLSQAGLDRPNALQREVAHRTALLSGGHVLVLAATAAGKTGVGLMAAVRTVAQGRIAVLLVPTRALADEVYNRLAKGWMVGQSGEQRVRVAISTGEHSREDALIRAGRVDVVVAVYEKFRSLLAGGPGLVARLGCVVADEIHVLADPQRGPAVDMLMTGLLNRGGAVQVVGLGGAVEDGSLLAGWMGGDCLVWRDRPGILREGTLCLSDGWFCYRSPDGMAGHGLERLLEPLAPTDGSAATAHGVLASVGRLARTLASRGENLLVFVPTRRLAREWACWLSAALGETQETEGQVLPQAYEAIEASEEGHGRRLLLDCGRSGVAFHSGDLPLGLRKAVEEAFGSGDLKVLVSTPTLAEGVNLGCRNVLVVPSELVDGASGAELDRRRLANMGGRAGREADPQRPGRAMVLVQNRDQATAVWRDLLEPRTARLQATDSEEVLEAMALDAISTFETPVSLTQLRGQLMGTFAGVTRWTSVEESFARRLTGAVHRLQSWGLLAWSEEETPRIEATATGRLAAQYGLVPSVAQWLAAVLPGWPTQEAEGSDVESSTELNLLLMAAHCLPPTDTLIPTPAPGSLRATGIHQTLAARLTSTLPALNACRDLRRVLPSGELAAGVRALLGQDWLAGEPLTALESRYRVFGGAMAGLGMLLSHGLQAMGALAAVLGAHSFPQGLCADLAARLPEGLPSWASGLAGLSTTGVTRGDLLRLAREGYDSLPALEESQPGTLERILTPTLGAQLREEVRLRMAATRCFPVWDALTVSPIEEPETNTQSSRGHRPTQNTTAHRHRTLPTSPKPADRVGYLDNQSSGAPAPGDITSGFSSQPRLILDPASPGEARVLGQLVHLSPLGYQLLQLLASRPGQVVSYLLIRDTLWKGLRVGDQQVRFHKRRLLQTLEQVGALNWIETRHGHGLLLRLTPEEVMLNGRPSSAAVAA